MNSTVTKTQTTTKKTTPASKSKKQVKKQKANKNVVKPQKAALQWKVPDCAMHYMTALVNPFDAPTGACLPAELFPLPSGKFKVFVRFKFNLGTAGIGFCSATPSFTSDGSCITATTSSSVLASSALFNTATNMNNVTCSQNQYTNAQSAGAVSFRSVAYGLRIKYIGQLMTRNGISISMEDEDHRDVRGLYSFDTLSAAAYSHAERTGEAEWDNAVCCSGPTNPNEFDFLNASSSATWPLLIAISGVAGDLYEGEFFHHYEAIGNVVTNKTRSHSDPEMTGKVLESTKSVVEQHPLSPKDGPSVFTRFIEGVKSSIPTIVGGLANRIIPGSGGFVEMLTGALPGVGQSINPADTRGTFGAGVRLLTGGDDHFH